MCVSPTRTGRSGMDESVSWGSPHPFFQLTSTQSPGPPLSLSLGQGPLPCSPAQAQNRGGARELGADESVEERMPGVPFQGGSSSWPEGTLSWGRVAGWGPVPEGVLVFA